MKKLLRKILLELEIPNPVHGEAGYNTVSSPFGMRKHPESGEEKMVAVCLLGDISELRIHSGKQFMKVGIKDLENYFAARAKRGLMLPQGYRKVDALEEVVINQEASE